MRRWWIRIVLRGHGRRARRYALDHAHDPDGEGYRRPLMSSQDWSNELQRYIPKRGPVR